MGYHVAHAAVSLWPDPLVVAGVAVALSAFSLGMWIRDRAVRDDGGPTRQHPSPPPADGLPVSPTLPQVLAVCVAASLGVLLRGFG